MPSSSPLPYSVSCLVQLPLGLNRPGRPDLRTFQLNSLHLSNLSLCFSLPAHRAPATPCRAPYHLLQPPPITSYNTFCESNTFNVWGLQAMRSLFAVTPACPCNTKATPDNTYPKDYGTAPRSLCFESKRLAWSLGHALLTPAAHGAFTTISKWSATLP